MASGRSDPCALRRGRRHTKRAIRNRPGARRPGFRLPPAIRAPKPPRLLPARYRDPMQFAVGVPNVREYGDPNLLLQLGVLSEEAGWDGFFVWDHLVYRDSGDPVSDPWIAATAVAARTTRMRLGVMVCALPRRR